MKFWVVSLLGFWSLVMGQGAAQAGTYKILHVPGASDTEARAVSSNNVAGNFYDPSNGDWRGFLYNGSTYTTLTPTAGTTSSYAWGVSGNTVVGEFYDPANGDWRGFLYNGSTYTTLTPTAGTTSSYARGVSGNTVVGS